jgi:hypothetical protein
MSLDSRPGADLRTKKRVERDCKNGATADLEKSGIHQFWREGKICRAAGFLIRIIPTEILREDWMFSGAP